MTAYLSPVGDAQRPLSSLDGCKFKKYLLTKFTPGIEFDP